VITAGYLIRHWGKNVFEMYEEGQRNNNEPVKKNK
jgi:hypothetical protein